MPDDAVFFFLDENHNESKHAPRVTRVPLSIYVMWHPSFEEGETLARDVYTWFGGITRDARAVGLGIPVHFRSAAWDESMALTEEEAERTRTSVRTVAKARDAKGRAIRRPVDLAHADHNVFVPLVDDNMVDDASWRRDLLALAEVCERGREGAATNKAARAKKTENGANPPVVHLVPVQVSPSWTRLPGEVTSIQALFLRRWTDDKAEAPSERLARWRVLLRRLLTQALVRLLRTYRENLGEGKDNNTTLPTEVFLSHAKADGTLGPGIAEQLRDVAAGYGQLDVFYDENDLPSASPWSSRMLNAAGGGAGFIAVLSDAYATRYWCRREVEQARTPVRVGGEGPVWSVRPTVVAVTLAKAWSRLVPDLATVPAIAWQKDRATEVLDQLFLEALVAEFQLLYALSLDESVKEAFKGRKRPPIDYVTWTPDAASLLRLRRQNKKPWPHGETIAYPGYGFLPTEELDLGLAFGRSAQLVSYEQLADAIANVAKDSNWKTALAPFAPRQSKSIKPMARRPILALSAGDSDDVAARGYDGRVGSVHVDAAVLRFCRAILDGDIRIAYGGKLREDRGFTDLLYDVVSGVAPVGGGDDPDARLGDPATPLVSYVAGPNVRSFDVARRASMAGLSRFVFVGQEAPPSSSARVKAVTAAYAMSEMRRRIAAETSATLALGGKRRNFSGLLPGVAEEILYAMECTTSAASRDVDRAEPEDVRVILLGEFGGAAGAMARYILGRTPELPSELTLAGNEEGSELVLEDPEARKDAEKRYAALARCLKGLRKIAGQPRTRLLPRLGLDVDEWRRIMASSSPGYVRRLLREKVVPALHRGAGARRAKR